MLLWESEVRFSSKLNTLGVKCEVSLVVFLISTLKLVLTLGVFENLKSITLFSNYNLVKNA